MYASAAFALAIIAQLAGAQPARFGYEREIDGSNVPNKLFHHILNEDNLSLKQRAKLITRPIPDDALAADNVIVESNVLRLLKPSKRVRRGYNLEHVNVPAAYPYLPVARANRFRRRNDYPRYSYGWY